MFRFFGVTSCSNYSPGCRIQPYCLERALLTLHTGCGSRHEPVGGYAMLTCRRTGTAAKTRKTETRTRPKSWGEEQDSQIRHKEGVLCQGSRALVFTITSLECCASLQF